MAGFQHPVMSGASPGAQSLGQISFPSLAKGDVAGRPCCEERIARSSMDARNFTRPRIPCVQIECSTTHRLMMVLAVDATFRAMSCRPTSPFRTEKKHQRVPRVSLAMGPRYCEHVRARILWYISSQSVHSPERSDIALAETWIGSISCHLDRLLLRSARRPSRMRSIHSGSFPAQLTSIMWALDIRVNVSRFCATSLVLEG